MRPDLLHGFLQRHPPIFEIEGGHVLVVEDPASCFRRRIEGCDHVIRVKSLQVINHLVR